MARLSAADLAFFQREGYLVARQVVPHAYLDALRAELNQTIARKADELLAAGKISHREDHLGFLHRATAIAGQCREILQPVTDGNFAGASMYRLLVCPELLDVVEQLVGPEIVASSVYRLRPKLPFRPEGVVPWHQDSGYFDSMGDRHLLLTVWIPLMHATVEAGCMEAIPQSHRDGIRRHYWANNPAPPLTVHPDHLPAGTPVPLPAEYGDVVLLTNFTVHRSTPNTSGQIRWSADLRYNAPEAGDYYPFERGFLARSRQHPAQVLADAAAFTRLRSGPWDGSKSIDRSWLKEADETFIKPPR